MALNVKPIGDRILVGPAFWCLESTRVPHALLNVSFDSTVIVRRETRRTATGTVALPET